MSQLRASLHAVELSQESDAVSEEVFVKIVKIKKFQKFCRSFQNCVIIEGFADRSVAKASGVKLLVFFKNIQPISVGV